MSLDRELRELKEQYKQNPDTKFTSTDREAVYQRISENKSGPIRKNFHSIQVALTLAAALFIGFLFIINVEDSNEPASETESEQDQELIAEPNKSTIEGYVTKIKNNQFIVTNPDTEESVIFTNHADHRRIGIGYKIKAWYEVESDGDPPLASIGKYDVLNRRSVNGSNLNETVAIHAALRHNDLSRYSSSNFPILLISSVEFNKEKGMWTIAINHSFRELTQIIHIDDDTGYVTTLNEPPEEVMEEAYTFNYEDYGDRFEELEKEIRLSLNSDWTSLYNIARQDYQNRTGTITNIDFSYKLNGAAIDSDGTVTIDFQPFEAAQTTAEAKGFFDEISRLVFQFDEAQQIYLQYNGSRKPEDSPFEAGSVEPIQRKQNIQHFIVEWDVETAIQAYSGTFRYLFQNTNGGQLDFQTMDEIYDFFTRTMSMDLAEQHISIYISEFDDQFHLNTFRMPPVIDIQEEYETKQIDEQTYQVKQEIQTERGDDLVTYIIKYNDYKWYVDSVEIESIRKH